jgi:glycosyltransferase involved in cell wall biosynthesis
MKNIELSNITPIIISYHRPNSLELSLKTLKMCDNIIVWDNNTTGGDLDKLKIIEKKYPNVKFIWSKENVGWSKACNQGIILSKTDWVMLCASDMDFNNKGKWKNSQFDPNFYSMSWLDILNNILKEKPQLEQIHLNAWNAMAIHKQTIVRMGWWDERYKLFPTMDDDDWYLRTVELMGYSPYSGFPSHFPFPEDYKNSLQSEMKLLKHHFNKDNNFTYYCNSPHSEYPIIGFNTITGQKGEDLDHKVSKNIKGEMTGEQFHHIKWKPVDPRLETIDNNRILLGKDGRCWKRNIPDLDFYPEIRNEYAKKYFNLELYENINNTAE